jgi:hypothetical protein
MKRKGIEAWNVDTLCILCRGVIGPDQEVYIVGSHVFHNECLEWLMKQSKEKFEEILKRMPLDTHEQLRKMYAEGMKIEELKPVKAGVPKTEKERVMAHYNLTEEQFQKLYSAMGERIFELLPPRGERVREMQSESQPRIGGKLVELDFPEDAEKIAERLHMATGRGFASTYDTATGKVHVVPVKIVDSILTFDEPLTEDELLRLDEPTYQYYKFIKSLRARQLPPRRDYYTIKIGETVFGELSPRRGRITSRDEALRILNEVTLSQLWNYHYGGPGIAGVWKPIRLLHIKSEDATPEVIVELKTPEEALNYVGREAFEMHVREVKGEGKMKTSESPSEEDPDVKIITRAERGVLWSRARSIVDEALKSTGLRYVGEMRIDGMAPEPYSKYLFTLRDKISEMLKEPKRLEFKVSTQLKGYGDTDVYVDGEYMYTWRPVEPYVSAFWSWVRRIYNLLKTLAERELLKGEVIKVG